MKEKKRIILAYLILVGLIVWLIIISHQRSEQINQQNEKIQQLIEQSEQNKIDLDNLKPPQNQTIIRQIGVPGERGEKGDSIQGLRGFRGFDGKSIKGDKGDTVVGKSAYQLWLSIGNTGSPIEFLNSLKGQDGDSPPAIRVRCNPDKLQNEWQYIGDFNWTPLDRVLECA